MRIRQSFTVRVRAASEGEPQGIVEGVASVYNTDYSIGNRLNERILPGAFDASLRQRGGVIPVYLHHGGIKNGDAPIGHATATSDANGLNVEAQLYIDTERARSVFHAMESGAISEWSIGAQTPNDTDVRVRSNSDGTRTEEILRADLLEVSVVLSGANPHTSTSRTRDAGDDDQAQIEQAKQALAIIAGLIPGEAMGLAEGDFDEIYDIGQLCDAYRALYYFVLGEQAEITENALDGYEFVLRARRIPAPFQPEWDRLSDPRYREYVRRSSAPSVSNQEDATASPTT